MQKEHENFVNFMVKKSEQKEEMAKPSKRFDEDVGKIEQITDNIQKRLQQRK